MTYTQFPGILELRLKHILILLFLFNHSLMFGVIEAAHLPDADHPYGHAVGYHAHDNAQDNEDVHSADHDTQPHGLHIHLNIDLPSNPDFAFPRAGSQQLAASTSSHQNLAYAPPVPPPNV